MFFRILRLAEMLKPLMSYEEMQREAQISTATLSRFDLPLIFIFILKLKLAIIEYSVFALNKARPSDQERRIIMEREIEGFMGGSRINYKGN